VSRGGDGWRNISELNACRPCGVRRIRWNRIGSESATKPAMYRGARNVMTYVDLLRAE
jgi:hypothetical protein